MQFAQGREVQPVHTAAPCPSPHTADDAPHVWPVPQGPVPAPPHCSGAGATPRSAQTCRRRPWSTACRRTWPCSQHRTTRPGARPPRPGLLLAQPGNTHERNADCEGAFVWVARRVTRTAHPPLPLPPSRHATHSAACMCAPERRTSTTTRLTTYRWNVLCATTPKPSTPEASCLAALEALPSRALNTVAAKCPPRSSTTSHVPHAARSRRSSCSSAGPLEDAACAAALTWSCHSMQRHTAKGCPSAAGWGGVGRGGAEGEERMDGVAAVVAAVALGAGWEGAAHGGICGTQTARRGRHARLATRVVPHSQQQAWLQRTSKGVPAQPTWGTSVPVGQVTHWGTCHRLRPGHATSKTMLCSQLQTSARNLPGLTAHPAPRTCSLESDPRHIRHRRPAAPPGSAAALSPRLPLLLAVPVLILLLVSFGFGARDGNLWVSGAWGGW